jgi:hypothetical protein
MWGTLHPALILWERINEILAEMQRHRFSAHFRKKRGNGWGHNVRIY